VTYRAQFKEVQAAASEAGQQVQILRASNEAEIDTAFATMTQSRAAALLVGADPLFLTRHDHVVALAARNAIPTIYEQREFVMAGGLMSYGTSLTEASRQVGVYTGRVLKGKKARRPAGIAVGQVLVRDYLSEDTRSRGTRRLGVSLRTRRSIRPTAFWLDDASDRAQNVCFWHLADIATAAPNVRYWGDSRYRG
jgi:DNA-binding LacI/PurR family transcriptional regulator